MKVIGTVSDSISRLPCTTQDRKTILASYLVSDIDRGPMGPWTAYGLESLGDQAMPARPLRLNFAAQRVLGLRELRNRQAAKVINKYESSLLLILRGLKTLLQFKYWFCLKDPDLILICIVTKNVLSPQ